MAQVKAILMTRSTRRILSKHEANNRSLSYFALVILLGISAMVPMHLWAQDISVSVSRKTSEYYQVHGSSIGILKTSPCFEFVYFSSATLRLFSSTMGSLTFQSGRQCTVVNVFNRATVSPGTYAINVNSAGDGFYELTDGSFLIEATGIDFAFGSPATLRIISAVNGVASGTITISGSSPRSLTYIYARNGASENRTDLVITGMDLRTDRYDAGGTVITDLKAGSTAWPHIFFDVVGGTVSGIKIYEIKIGNTTLCSFAGELAVGSYWGACNPISIPSGQFTLSGSLDPSGSLTESNENNNFMTKVYVSTDVASDQIFRDRFSN